MKTGWKVTILCGMILGAGFGLRVCAALSAPSFPHSTLTITTASGPHKLNVEVARSREQQEYGLMFRNHLADDAGMIFIWDKPEIVTMWMKNTFIPLDMVFLDAAGTVTHVMPDAKPQSTNIISSMTPASAVIELNGGAAAKLGIVSGDKVDSPDLTPAPPTP